MLAAAVMCGAGTLVVAMPTAAFAESTYSMESEFIAKMNGAREANGQAPYAVYSDLTSMARSHSQDMARSHSLYHNPNLTSQMQNWQACGENVGEGPTVDDIHQAFMNSTEHRDNILDHDFTQVGVGVAVDKNGTIWVTEDFREPMHSSSGSGSSHHSSWHQSSSGSTTTYHPSTSVPSSSGAPMTTAAPRSAPSPRVVLLRRLQRLRSHPGKQPSDPVAQSFDYVATLSRLTG